MGQMADDIIDGSSCALCRQYFIEMNKGETVLKTDGKGVVNNATIYSHGFPVVCKECYEPGCGYQKATADTV